MKKPIISVIVPVYNSEKYIIKCIDSILNQSFTDFELIIVDDGSQDNSISLINENFIDDRIRIIHKDNEGLPQARRTGFINSFGEYIVFVDSDDWIDIKMLELLYAKAIDFGSDIVCCGIRYDDILGKVLSVQSIRKEKEFNSLDAIKLLHERKGFYTFMWNKLFKRNTLSEEFFPHGNFIGEDYTTIINILTKNYKIFHIKDICYHYVQHDSNSIISGFGSKQEIAYNNYSNLLKMLINKYPSLKYDILCYHYLEKMAIVNSMIRGDKFDFGIFDEIKLFMKKYLMRFMFSKMQIVYKISALVMLMNFNIYKKIYLLLK